MDPSKPATTTTSIPSSNPPSVEIAYKRKSLALKKRLNEVEAENELMRVRNKRGWKYIQKMRLESCMLLERLAKVTGMAEEAQAGSNPELRARAAALMSNAAALNGVAEAGAGAGGQAAGNGTGYFEDETEGSSDEQPPTPQERPLRMKRSRKSNANNDAADDELPPPPPGNNVTNNLPPTGNMPDTSRTSSTSLPRLAPAPSQEEMTSSFRIRTGSNGSVPNEREIHASAAPPAAGYGYPPPDQHNSHPSPYHPLHSGLSHMHPPAPEQSTTPMDVDTKDMKEES